MTQIALAGNSFPLWVPGHTPKHAFEDEAYENYPEKRYLAMQYEPSIVEARIPHRRPTHDLQVLLGIPMPLQSQSSPKHSNVNFIPDLDPFLVRQSELVDISQNKPSTVKTPQERARRLFLLPPALSENTKQVVGENGLKRFEEFITYPDGWDYGRGSALSGGSVRVLNSFLKELPELGTYEPSLFLTHLGNLQLGWEDLNGDVVELEFFRRRIEYYVEALNEEGSVGVQDQSKLVEKIRSTIE